MIYNKITQIREFKNITIEAMAFELEISVSVYAKIENGAVDLKLSKVFKIAKFLGVSVFDLFESSEFILKEDIQFIQDSTNQKTDISSTSCAEQYILNLKAQNQKLNQKSI
jgi:transcriptional regulator with XRE-family HTH domain